MRLSIQQRAKGYIGGFRGGKDHMMQINYSLKKLKIIFNKSEEYLKEHKKYKVTDI